MPVMELDKLCQDYSYSNPDQDSSLLALGASRLWGVCVAGSAAQPPKLGTWLPQGSLHE